jgi:hypothetical protein
LWLPDFVSLGPDPADPSATQAIYNWLLFFLAARVYTYIAAGERAGCVCTWANFFVLLPKLREQQPVEF